MLTEHTTLKNWIHLRRSSNSPSIVASSLAMPYAVIYTFLYSSSINSRPSSSHTGLWYEFQNQMVWPLVLQLPVYFYVTPPAQCSCVPTPDDDKRVSQSWEERFWTWSLDSLRLLNNFYHFAFTFIIIKEKNNPWHILDYLLVSRLRCYLTMSDLSITCLYH